MDEMKHAGPDVGDDGLLHETYVELNVTRVGSADPDPVDPDAAAYQWVCACGDGADELAKVDAYLEARRHERLAV